MLPIEPADGRLARAATELAAQPLVSGEPFEHPRQIIRAARFESDRVEARLDFIENRPPLAARG